MSGYRFDRLKILVVDDNPHMRKLVTTILQAFGCIHVYEACEGRAALKVLHECNPDVVLLDWMMEGMSGLDFATQVRTSPASPNPCVPIVMLTGNTSMDCVNAARDAGINEFLAKPVSVKAVMVRLMAVIEHPRAFVRTKAYLGPCRRRRAKEGFGSERRADGDDLRAAS